MLARYLHIIDLGQCLKFLSIIILHDYLNCCLWLSLHIYVLEFLDEWNLLSCKPTSIPFPSNVMDLPPAPANSLPAISDANMIPKYQHLVGCLLYLDIAT